MTALLERNRAGGPEQVMRVVAERAPGGFADVHDVISREELAEIATSFKRAAGFAPEQLRARETYSRPAVTA